MGQRTKKENGLTHVPISVADQFRTEIVFTFHFRGLNIGFSVIFCEQPLLFHQDELAYFRWKMTNRRRMYMVLEIGTLCSPSSDHTSVVSIVRHLPRLRCALISNHRFVMSVARGTFEVAFSNFTGVFDADGFDVIVQGRFSQSIESLSVRNAQVTYSDLRDFTGSYSVVSGIPPSYVGTDAIDVEFEDSGGKNLRLTGTIQVRLGQRYTVTGSGTWSMRKRGDD